jgi:predicted ATPase
VGGEQVWPLRSLDLPDPAGGVHEVAASAAGRPFCERAASARPSFVLSEANVAAVGEICRRLDGIPLAIELAAARVAALTPAEIAGLLDERFRLLTGGRRTAVERHQTLRATVDWSYELLSPTERACRWPRAPATRPPWHTLHSAWARRYATVAATRRWPPSTRS